MTAYTFGVIQFAFVTDIIPVPIHNVPGQMIYPGPLSLCTNYDIYNRNMTRASSRHSFSLSVNLLFSCYLSVLSVLSMRLFCQHSISFPWRARASEAMRQPGHITGRVIDRSPVPFPLQPWPRPCSPRSLVLVEYT